MNSLNTFTTTALYVYILGERNTNIIGAPTH